MLIRLGFHRSWAQVAALASAGAAAIHFAAARPHLMEWAPAGGFMLASGLAQLAWAVWMATAPGDEAVVAGVALNAGIIGLWALSRTVGLPFGPNAGLAEHIHADDALATVLEALVVAASLRILTGTLPSRVFTVFAAAATAVAPLATAHDVTRERLTAGAVLAGALAARALVTLTIQSMQGRRIDVYSIIRRNLVPVGVADRPNLGACEPGSP